MKIPSKLKQKFQTLVFTRPDGVEVFVSIIKLVWAAFILASADHYLQDHIFYFLSGSALVSFYGYVLLVNAIVKLWAWWSDNICLQKWMTFIGLLMWIFIAVNTYFSDLPKFTLIQFMVLIVSDFWLYIRLGALRNVRSSSD